MVRSVHALLTNIVVAWNTSRTDGFAARLKRDGVEIEEDWLRRIGPAHFSHFNFLWSRTECRQCNGQPTVGCGCSLAAIDPLQRCGDGLSGLLSPLVKGLNPSQVTFRRSAIRKAHRKD